MNNVRKAFLLTLIGAVGVVGMSSFQPEKSTDCKIDDVIAKYKSDKRCNSVSIGKPMLDILIKQRKMNDENHDLKGVNSVNIISVKMQNNKMGFTFNFNNMGEEMEMETGSNGATVRMKNEKSAQERKEQREKELQQKNEDLRKLGEALTKEAVGCVTSASYTELMSVNDNGKAVKYYAKQAGDLIVEFVAVTEGKNEYSIILIKGTDIKITSLGMLSNLVPNADIDIDLY